MFKQITTITALYAVSSSQEEYQINSLNLHMQLGAGCTCSFVLSGIVGAAQDLIDVDSTDTGDVFQAGDTVTICMEYTQDGRATELCYLAEGRIIGIDHSFTATGSTYAQVTQYTIADSMQFISTTPLGQIYTYNAVVGGSVIQTPDILSRKSSGSDWAKMQGDILNGGKYFNVPAAVSKLLDTLLETPLGSKPKTLKVSDVVAIDKSPTMLVSGTSAGMTLFNGIKKAVNARYTSVPPAEMFKQIIGEYFLALGYYRDNNTGRWIIRPIMDMPWDRRTVLNSSASAGDILEVFTSKLMLIGCPNDAFDAVAVRFARIWDKSGKELKASPILRPTECAICVETNPQGVPGNRVSKLVEVVITKTTKDSTLTLKDKDSPITVSRMLTINMPDWIQLVYDPSGKLSKTTTNEEYQKKWAKVLARAYYALHNRERSTLTVSVPLLKALDMTCDSLGRVVGVSVPQSNDVSSNTSINYYGRVTSIDIGIALGKDFRSSTRIELSHVRNTVEHENLSVDCSELMKITED